MGGKKAQALFRRGGIGGQVCGLAHRPGALLTSQRHPMRRVYSSTSTVNTGGFEGTQTHTNAPLCPGVEHPPTVEALADHC